MQNCKMWIGGKWIEAKSGKTFAAFNAATGDEIARVPIAGQADIDKAVEAARQALPIWSKKTQTERSDILLRMSEAITANASELAEVDIISHGLPPAAAQRWPMLMSQMIQNFARLNQGFTGKIIPASEDKMNCLLREPRGVCALFVSWNAAYGSAAKKMPAALATGNTCIIKAPSMSSLLVIKLAEVLETVGLPPGTVNIVTGPGGSTGEILAAHPGVDMVSFTGGTDTGKRIMSLASNTVKHVVLELGGKNPFIVLEDADVDKAVARAVMGVADNAGQACIAPGRFYAHKDVYDKFLTKMVAGIKGIAVGAPGDEKAQMGPLFSAEHRDRVEAYIRSGIDEGAKLMLGGKRPAKPLDKGYFVMPTILTEVTQNMTIAREEIFGPVAVIMKPFSSDDDVINLANENTFGLTAYIWTRDIARGIRMAKQIQFGSVYLNNGGGPGSNLPHGGFKESGQGKEESTLGLEEYVHIKAIAIDLAK
jgi:betaine-aldehyde dehydrogenase